MGVRGEIFSTKVALQNRTYFFNVKENRMGDLYLNIVESKNRETGGFERQSLVLFNDDLREFLSGFDASLKVMEKAAKEKKKFLPRKPKPEEFETKPRSGDFETAGSPAAKKKYGRKNESDQKPKSGKDQKPWDKKPRPKAIKAVRRENETPKDF